MKENTIEGLKKNCHAEVEATVAWGLGMSSVITLAL